MMNNKPAMTKMEIAPQSDVSVGASLAQVYGDRTSEQYKMGV